MDTPGMPDMHGWETMEKPIRPTRPDAGMTLLELMIAAGIMATGLVLLMGSLATITHTGASSEERAIAAAHMSTLMEELAQTNIDTLFDYEPPAFPGLQRERVTITCVDSAGELVPLPADPSQLANPIPNPVEIRIVVDWRSRSGHPHRVTAATFHRL